MAKADMIDAEDNKKEKKEALIMEEATNLPKTRMASNRTTTDEI